MYVLACCFLLFLRALSLFLLFLLNLLLSLHLFLYFRLPASFLLQSRSIELSCVNSSILFSVFLINLQVTLLTLFSLVSQLPLFPCAPVPPAPFAEFPIVLYVYVPVPLDLSQSFLYVYLRMMSARKAIYVRFI